MGDHKLRKRNTYANSSRMLMRQVVVRAETANTDDRSVEVIIATENPVQRYDRTRSEVINEVLAMDGVEFRTSKRQLPIVDSHDNTTVKNVLGSVRNLRVVDDELVGDAVFAADADSQDAFQKLRDGHLTDFSITASPNEVMYVPRGESTSIRNRTIDGPAEIVTRWRPTDASLVATGADERSTVRSELRRSYDLATKQENDDMNQSLIEKLKSLGMPDDIEGEEAIDAWLTDNLKADEPAADEQPAEVPESKEPELVGAGAGEDSSDVVDRALKADRLRQREIRMLCSRANIERSVADELCDDGVSVDHARKVVLEKVIKREPAVGTTVTVKDGIDRFAEAAHDGLIKRAVQASGCSSYDPFASKPAADGAEDFQHMGMLRLAEQLLQRGGINTSRMNARDIASVALGHQPTIERFGIRRDDAAYHVTGTFSNILQDAANKTLLAGYEEAPYTWSLWARQAGSVSDFKSIKRNRFSEAPDLDVVPENAPYPEGAMSDEKETYSIDKYGQIFSVSWETVVNDDLDAISRVPAMHGNAARRTQNKKVYEVLTANAAMADTGTLFNTTAQTTAGGHANQASSGGAISVSTLNAGFLSMMTKKGLNSSVTINVQPSFLIVPAAIAATAMQVVGSIADPTSTSNTADFNSNTLNIYGPNGSRPLRVVADPVLDADSATKWYLAASPAQIDTVELAFLAGEETPVLDTEFDFTRDVWRYKIRQTFGVAAIDFRGLYYNPGA